MFFKRSGIAAVAAAWFASTTVAQTWSSCNPLSSSSCPADSALGMSVNVDFTQGEVNAFVPSGGSPTYGHEGASFTVAKSGDSPQLISIFYIMFGRVEVTMKAAPGAGIVSSLVLLSDVLDEIDMEWLGSDDSEVQTNYFSKGQTTSYNRGEFNPAPNNQGEFITYTIDWTPDRIIWYVGGTVVRTLTYDAADGQYPQTPMQVKFGAWAGGDPSNPPGTVEWARGPTDYSKGPFTMLVRSAVVTDYSTGKKYTYGDQSGSWQSIRSDSGKINGNANGAGSVTVTASASAATGSLSPTIPPGGIIGGTATDSAGSPSRTVGTIPDGWVMTSDGKVVPVGSSTTPPAEPCSSSSSAPFASRSQEPGNNDTTFATSIMTTAAPPSGSSADTPEETGTAGPSGSGGTGVPKEAPGVNGAAAGVSAGGFAVVRVLLAAVVGGSVGYHVLF